MTTDCLYLLNVGVRGVVAVAVAFREEDRQA